MEMIDDTSNVACMAFAWLSSVFYRYNQNSIKYSNNVDDDDDDNRCKQRRILHMRIDLSTKNMSQVKSFRGISRIHWKFHSLSTVHFCCCRRYSTFKHIIYRSVKAISVMFALSFFFVFIPWYD